MEIALGVLCILLCVLVFVLLGKLADMRHAAATLRAEFAARLQEDTNVGIDIITRDKQMLALAADMDSQLKQLRKAYLRYAQGDRELKEAITNISHDLRTPLTAICGYMELLEQEEMSLAAKESLAIIKNRVEALKQLTEELFRYSVVMSVPPQGNSERVPLNKALEECVAGLYTAMKEKGITPEISIPDKRIDVRVNKVALSRALNNVINNAVKYSDGDLHITLAPDGVITCQNRAPQLSEVAVGRLFDRFFTVNNGQGGTGLGLAIAKILIEQMGGSIAATLHEQVFTVEIHMPLC